jgi:hypothetical protein
MLSPKRSSGFLNVTKFIYSFLNTQTFRILRCKKKTPWPSEELGSSKQTRKSWLSTGLHVCIPESLPGRAIRILISYTFWPRWWVSSLTCPKRRGISVLSHTGEYFPNIDQSKYLTRTQLACLKLLLSVCQHSNFDCSSQVKTHSCLINGTLLLAKSEIKLFENYLRRNWNLPLTIVKASLVYLPCFDLEFLICL